MRVIGEKPRPRGLIHGFDDETATRLSTLFPTARRIGKTSEIRQAEWDVVVTAKTLEGFDDHLFALSFGATYLGATTIRDKEYDVRVTAHLTQSSIATEFIIANGLESPLLQLVERELVPLVQSQSSNPILSLSEHFRRPASSIVHGQIAPFLSTTEPNILAGSFTRSETNADVWFLPPGLKDPVPWVSAALSTWSKRDRARFPIDPLWRSNDDWLTRDESLLAESLRELSRERGQALADFEAREENLRAELDFARRQADEGLRLLLTGSGDGLVGAVATALEILGFDVSNRDEVNPPNDRREDLWVTSPDDPDWIALAEVRGYAKGAAQGDLLRLSGRFAKRFSQEQGREPSRLWYIVNHFAGSDPSSRPLVLGTNPGEVAAFSEEGGMVMDTASLFNIVRAVQEANPSAADIRREMRLALGRFPPDTAATKS